MEQEKKMNAAESLELISSMIRSSRRDLARNSYRPFLIWGYTTVVVSIIELILHLVAEPTTSPALRLWIWWAIPVIGSVLMLIFRDRDNQTKSPLDINIGAVWGVLSFTLVPILSNIIIISGRAGYVILPMVLVVMGAGSLITGIMCKMKPIIYGGWASMIGSVAMSVLSLWFIKSSEVADAATQACLAEGYISGQMVIFIISFVLSMILPGHYMKRMFNNEQEG